MIQQACHQPLAVMIQGVQPPIEEVHVYGSMSGSSWSCEGWVCQDFLRDIFRTQEGYSSDKGGWHDYTEGPNLVCGADLGCTQQEMVDQFSRFAVPGQSPSRPVTDGSIYKVYDPRNGIYAGKVVTTVSVDGLTIINTTLPGHVFHDGQITRSLSQNASGAWYVTTRGIGNNYVPFTAIGCDACAAVNSWQGRKIFNYVDSQMRMNIEAHH